MPGGPVAAVTFAGAAYATTIQLTTVTSAGAVDRLLLAFGGCGGR